MEPALAFSSGRPAVGFEKPLTLELLHAQLLRRVPAQVGLKQQGDFVERDSLQTLLNNLKPVTTIRSMPEQGIPLLLVCIEQWVGENGFDARSHPRSRGQIARLPPKLISLPLTDLWFVPQAVQDLLAYSVKMECDRFTKEEVRAYLSVSWRTLYALLAKGLLCPMMALGNSSSSRVSRFVPCMKPTFSRVKSRKH